MSTKQAPLSVPLCILAKSPVHRGDSDLMEIEVDEYLMIVLRILAIGRLNHSS